MFHNAIYFFNKTPLNLAIEFRNAEIVKLILANPDIDYYLYKHTISKKKKQFNYIYNIVLFLYHLKYRNLILFPI